MLKSLRKDDLSEKQNSSLNFVKYSLQKWHTVNMAWSAMSRRVHNLCQKFCPRQMMHSLFNSNRPTVRQQFDNDVICSTYNLYETMEWRLEDSVFVSVLKSLPSGPDACADLIFRACTKQSTQISANAECLIQVVSCLLCTATCKCHATGDICYNSWRMMKCFIHWQYVLTGC